MAYRENVTNCNDLDVVSELKKRAAPILIYGCANHAEQVWIFLKKHGLDVEAFIVDRQYFRKDFYLKGTAVRNIEEYMTDIESYSIVIGFCDVCKTRFLINGSRIVKGHFYLLWEPIIMFKWDEKYLRDRKDEIECMYNSLADERSREVMRELIYAKLNRCGRKMLAFAEGKQYFNELTFCPNSENEIFVDCGAYTGDTIAQYVNFTDGVYKKIYAFEPNAENAALLKRNTKDLRDVLVIEKATWDEKGIVEFDEKGSASQIVRKGTGKTEVSVVTIDEIVGDDAITFIKMDVEGSELKSLRGAERAIARNMPKLAICCYHKKDDIWNFYRYIKKFNTEKISYRFYLKHHSNSAYETVLYAIPTKKRGNSR